MAYNAGPFFLGAQNIWDYVQPVTGAQDIWDYVQPVTVNKIPMSELQGSKKIGSGAFSTVYQMTWTRQLGAIQVAAKKLNKPDDDKELKMLSRLEHPNIIKLLGVVDEGINFLLILELCEGGSLRSYLDGRKGNRLSTDQFFDWAKQAAVPIEYLNHMQIVHKDIKSPNILIAHGNTLKLADFGLAKDLAKTTCNATESASYPWMAPELLRSQVLSPSYDIFTYGVVLWEMWTLQFPHEGLQPVQIIWKVCEKNERLLIPKDMPEPVAALIKQCWEKDWKKRPSIQQILDVISSSSAAAKAAAWAHQKGQIIAGPWMESKRFGIDERGFPCNITINVNGDVAVISKAPLRVNVYDTNGNSKFMIYTSHGYYHNQITISPDGATYFLTDNSEYVKMYDVSGNFKGQWVSSHLHASPGDPSLCGLAMNARNEVLVGDIRSECINTHRQDGTFIGSFKVGIQPWFLGVTSQDTIVVVDQLTPPQIVSNTGEVIHTLKHPTDGLQWTPHRVHCYRDIIFITTGDNKSKNYEILCYSESGTYLGPIPIKRSDPLTIALTADGTEAIVGHLSGGYSIYSIPY